MKGSITDRILVGLLGLLFAGFLYTIRNSFEQRIIDKGDKAPSFAVTTDSGKRISTEDFGGRLLVLNFWATWCPPCIQEMPSLDRFARDMAQHGVVVLGVSVDKNEKVYKEFLQRARLAFNTARDPEADISADYGSFKWPETYIINDKGRVVAKYIGDRDWTDPNLVSSIRAML
jgi:cytochrome c biogenesis protein CcmG, thiol:disulfide interchange protein DsbE